MSIVALKNKTMQQDTREEFKYQVIGILEHAHTKLMGGDFCLLLLSVLGYCSKKASDYFGLEV